MTWENTSWWSIYPIISWAPPIWDFGIVSPFTMVLGFLLNSCSNLYLFVIFLFGLNRCELVLLWLGFLVNPSWFGPFWRLCRLFSRCSRPKLLRSLSLFCCSAVYRKQEAPSLLVSSIVFLCSIFPAAARSWPLFYNLSQNCMYLWKFWSIVWVCAVPWFCALFA